MEEHDNLLEDTNQAVLLQFSCKNLKDLCGKENPCPQIKIECDLGKRKLNERTDTVPNNQNPEFKKKIPIIFIFEEAQTLEISIFDTSVPDSEPIGWTKTALAEIIGAVHQTLTIRLLSSSSNSRAEIVIRAYRPKNAHIMASMQFEGLHLVKPVKGCLGLFTKVNPFITFSCKNEFTDVFEHVYSTNIVKNNRNPRWGGFKIPLSHFCNGNKDAPIKIDYYSDGPHKDKCLGTITTTFSKIEKKERLYLHEEHLERPSGVLKALAAITENKFGIVDFLFSGEQINLFMAVDLTASNKEASDPTSLHHRTSVKRSVYEEVFVEISESMMRFNSEKKIHAIGFGAQPKYPKLTAKSVQHCFPLSGEEYEVMDVDGLLAAYTLALNHTSFQGPPWLHQIVQHVTKEIEKSGSNNYNVLVVITDGEMYDKNQLVNAMVAASELGLSLIVIGVGNDKFDQLRILNDEQDIVEDAYLKKKLKRSFLKFIHYEDKEYKRNVKLLCKNVLKAISEQFLEYKSMMNVLPNIS